MTQQPAIQPPQRNTFPGISSRAWEHPADRTALTALRRLKGFDQVLKVLSGMLRERQHRLLYLASSARVGPRQFADLDELLDDCVQVLDAPARPEMFVTQSPVANAYTIGMDEPFIVITSGMYDLMSHDEMRFVIGHELGHALSGHAVYRTMLMHLMRIASTFGFVPVGGWALRAIVAALMEWERKSELSGDRAGLLCGQDLDTAIRVELKLAAGARLDKLDSQAFLAQAQEYERTGDMRDGLLKLLNLELKTHPFSVLRAAALTQWVDTGGYGTVMAGDYPRRQDDDKAAWRDDIGEAARHYRDGFDQSDDPLIRGIRDGLGGIVDGVGQAATSAADSLGRKISEWRRNVGRGSAGTDDPGSDAGSDGR
ncbi:M48 family metallopeptidase [Mycolicibacterium goodii]|uniref:M48 family metallopeptidase n=1 Tax=Mycolicibacterium goodii TaxID=134601 RepID=UPI001BDC1823|nr:M48 family metalloprotease [Mycolicibacterium goodii]MBU8818989.1 M48 family metalloprotease [Mycolicibacterium goodii]MBU8833881.1 M48 family metalloprotease [Mycolicibacterium goodii]